MQLLCSPGDLQAGSEQQMLAPLEKKSRGKDVLECVTWLGRGLRGAHIPWWGERLPFLKLACQEKR